MPAIDGANIVLAWPNEQVIRALDWLWMRIDNSDIQRQAP
jgi:hypothetical protein